MTYEDEYGRERTETYFDNDENLGDSGFVPPRAQQRTDVSFLTEDERRFFAYMADQRFRTVSEMDPEKREAARARWQEVAQWFFPAWDGNYRG